MVILNCSQYYYFINFILMHRELERKQSYIAASHTAYTEMLLPIAFIS